MVQSPKIVVCISDKARWQNKENNLEKKVWHVLFRAKQLILRNLFNFLGLLEDFLRENFIMKCLTMHEEHVFDFYTFLKVTHAAYDFVDEETDWDHINDAIWVRVEIILWCNWARAKHSLLF